ncbi:30S ribosome-binding factor RbfA [Thermoleptolyngbya sichuanensis A183]|uniref:Ribosome-binding factor A n=1 Tax=Thermoleptolyngbya sichuanensis A183 TaxID=2737172 RepID=A0A6M8BAZ3_9CYAN|nr:30S ribosome-binding factor RbfA [Thermoleptolyngbya sichuanensis A183]
MATDRRVSRVSELIKREVSQLLISGIKDDRVGVGMVSVTEVDVSGDLQHAKIFVSIYGSDEARAETMAGLKSATGYVRSTLGQRIRLRRTPEVVFVEDRSIERGTQVLSLLNRLSAERKPETLEALQSSENRAESDFSDEPEDEFDDELDDELEDELDDEFDDELDDEFADELDDDFDDELDEDEDNSLIRAED